MKKPSFTVKYYLNETIQCQRVTLVENLKKVSELHKPKPLRVAKRTSAQPKLSLKESIIVSKRQVENAAEKLEEPEIRSPNLHLHIPEIPFHTQPPKIPVRYLNNPGKLAIVQSQILKNRNLRNVVLDRIGPALRIESDTDNRKTRQRSTIE